MPNLLRLLIRIDLAVCALFALPWVSQKLLGAIAAFDTLVGLEGAELGISATGYFFVNLAGLFGVAYNAILLQSNKPAHHQINNYARVGVIVLLIAYLAFNALPVLFGIFVLTEILGLIVTHNWLRRA